MAKKVFEVTCEVTCEVVFDVADETKPIEPTGECTDKELVERAVETALSRHLRVCVADEMDGNPEIIAEVHSEIWEKSIEG